MKKKIMAVLAVIAAVLGFGFATNTAMADDYGATVTYSGTTATVTFPAGTFQPNESVTVYYDDAIVADVQQIAEVSKTFTAKADGSLTLLYTSHRTVWPLCCLPPRASPCSPSARAPLVADVTDIINGRR